MKSGIISQRDPFHMGSSLMVDPNFIFNYGTFKGINFDTDLTNTAAFQSTNWSEFVNSVEPHHPLTNDDSLIDILGCNDSQLENIILHSGFCGESSGIFENEFDIDEIFQDVRSLENEEQILCELEALKQEIELASNFPDDSYIANYEEVYADEWDKVDNDNDGIVKDNENNESLFSSYDVTSSESTDIESPKINTKRKLDFSQEINDINKATVKRKKTIRRTKRIQDDRVKNQNKMAALKYRKKKRTEKNDLEKMFELEEDKNKKLKASVEELKVNINVIKELLGKYLSSNQLIAATSK